MPELMVVLPDYVIKVLAALSNSGHRGYLVGGSLRDILRGVAPHDYDLTTNATPEEMLAAFSSFRTIPTGLRHGTLTVLSDGQPVEVTTHRVDGVYTDSRHPESVRFTTLLTEDLSRRDFTVNAMAWSAETGLVDPFGGADDLAARVLRAVGAPEKRFEEDALRILRLFRFAAQLDFTIDPATARGAAATAAGLARISAERVFGELTRTLIGQAAQKGLLAMRQCGCVPYVFGSAEPDFSLLPAFDRLPTDPAVRLAALLAPHGEETAHALCRALRTSNAFSHTVCGVIAAISDNLPQNEFEARRFVCSHYETWRAALAVLAAKGESVENSAALCEKVTRDRTAIDLHRLAVNGAELQQKAGIRAEKTAKTLRYLQEFVWREPQQNKKAALLAAAREYAQKEEPEDARK